MRTGCAGQFLLATLAIICFTEVPTDAGLVPRFSPGSGSDRSSILPEHLTAEHGMVYSGFFLTRHIIFPVIPL